MQTLAADAASEMGVELFSSIIIISYWVQPYLWGLWWGVTYLDLGERFGECGGDRFGGAHSGCFFRCFGLVSCFF